MRYKVEVSYDGSNYAGFQSQKNAVGIQDVLESALKHIYNQNIRITLASRTDAGVHAYANVFTFESDKQKDPYKIKEGINAFMPADIHVNKVEEVDDEFHPRYHSKYKTYEYLINIGEYNPLLVNRAYQCRYPLNLELMEEACELFVGTHDFTSFNTSPVDEYPNQIRTIKSLKMKRKGNLIIIEVTGTGFLKNMVRIIVGSLINLGRGKIEISEIKMMLDNPCKTTRRYNITPSGLYLKKIKY